jgi:archaellum component FlaC
VDKVRDAIQKVVVFIEAGGRSNEEIQEELDRMTESINDLQSEFSDAGSEIETGARESIGATVAEILRHFEIDIDIETAIRARDW